MDEEAGNIIIELAENDNTDNLISNLTTVGKLEIVDEIKYSSLEHSWHFFVTPQVCASG